MEERGEGGRERRIVKGEIYQGREEQKMRMEGMYEGKERARAKDRWSGVDLRTIFGIEKVKERGRGEGRSERLQIQLRH